MKRFQKIFFIFLILIVILLVIFWGRFTGVCAIFQMVSNFTDAVTNGSSELNFQLSGSWGKVEKRDSLFAAVQYQRDNFFLTDIRANGNQYIISSDNENTQVQILKKNLLVSGFGDDKRNFDILLLIGEILGNHPQLKPILSLNWFEKIGISAIAFFKADFKKESFQNQKFQVIELPESLLKKRLAIWQRADKKEIRIVASENKNPFTLAISLTERPARLPAVTSQATQKIEVPRFELNTAIHRGAVRAAGIMLENMMIPKADGIEQNWGKGNLTYVDGNRVLIARGTHREIGEAHGALLKKEVRKMVDATLYTIGWVYTMEKSRWFINDLRKAYQRLEPFIPQKYQEEMAGLAETAGISLEEIQLTNVFPEMFHCSGFALWGKATQDGVLYHGRVLDYMTEIGLQYHAVVFIYKPEGSNAFANIGYGGFIGSVSGMNDLQIAIGEMGGRGEGDWDGMPMAFLVREGLEKANSLDQALAIFKDTPRTCEYYYVISDGKIPEARGLATAPKRFELIEPNKAHPLLPHPFEDAVLMSAGDRYEKLTERVRENYGKIDCEKAIHLMDRPVAMKSNLHNVLFVPQLLEFWVANAGSHSPASNEPYYHYNLQELLALLEK
jgi:hypothetical protein